MEINSESHKVTDFETLGPKWMSTLNTLLVLREIEERGRRQNIVRARRNETRKGIKT